MFRLSVKRVRRSLDTESVKTLVHAFVTSRVDYCNSVLSSAPKKVMDKLQHVQNVAARLVTGTRKYERGLSTLMHDDLHWLIIPQRVQYKLAVTVHRCLQHRAPGYLADHCVPVSAICQTSSTVSSTSSTRHLWDPCFFCSRTNSLEFTARLSEGSSCRLQTI